MDQYEQNINILPDMGRYNRNELSTTEKQIKTQRVMPKSNLQSPAIKLDKKSILYAPSNEQNIKTLPDMDQYDHNQLSITKKQIKPQNAMRRSNSVVDISKHESIFNNPPLNFKKIIIKEVPLLEYPKQVNLYYTNKVESCRKPEMVQLFEQPKKPFVNGFPVEQNGFHAERKHFQSYSEFDREDNQASKKSILKTPGSIKQIVPSMHCHQNVKIVRFPG